MRHRHILALAAATAIGGALAAPAQSAEITMLRFFGDCAEEYSGVTDLAQAVGECGIIQVLTNKFNAENSIGATIVTQTADWGTYYDLLSATYAGGGVPDVAVMHRSVLPNFVARDLVMPLEEDLTAAGVDFEDFLPAAREAVTVDGTVYGLPFDLHTLLFHVNVDLMAEAGLVDEAGKPILPTSPDELLAHAQQMKERTGKTYFAMESATGEAMPVRLFNSWVWQQGEEVIAADASAAQIDTPAGQQALGLLDQIYAEGHNSSALDYAGAEQAFLNGDAAILINGTWVVDSYAAQAADPATPLKNYMVADVPSLFGEQAVWSDTHLWTVPRDESRSPEEHEAAVAFLAFLNEHNFHWARTGHLSVRSSVIDSEEFTALPHRSEYAGTATIARALPAIQNQRGIQDVMISEFTSVWLADKAPEAALSDTQRRVEQILRRSRR